MNSQQNKQIEDILNSLDGVKKAGAPDFFYTRLKARMERGIETRVSRPWILRPAFAMIAIGLVILVNAMVILRGQGSNETNGIDTMDTYQTIASEYNLNETITEEVYK